MRSTKAIRIAKISYIILSSLFIVLGVGLIALRDLSVSLIGIAAGVMLIAFGIVKLIGYFSKDLYRLAFQFDLSLGLMLVGAGRDHPAQSRPGDVVPVPDAGHRHHGGWAVQAADRRWTRAGSA